MSIKTRPGNVNKHPGAPDKPKPKRTHGEVQAERAQQAAQKDADNAERVDNIDSLAEMETNLKRQDRRRSRKACAPPVAPQRTTRAGAAGRAGSGHVSKTKDTSAVGGTEHGASANDKEAAPANTSTKGRHKKDNEGAGRQSEAHHTGLNMSEKELAALLKATIERRPDIAAHLAQLPDIIEGQEKVPADAANDLDRDDVSDCSPEEDNITDGDDEYQGEAEGQPGPEESGTEMSGEEPSISREKGKATATSKQRNLADVNAKGKNTGNKPKKTPVRDIVSDIRSTAKGDSSESEVELVELRVGAKGKKRVLVGGGQS
ncbi:hypothetical protein K474DRAFT_1703929 [Panus rudis PR-1116 ss-1]|nr:hypothetical protein K474DRAFT_1703929 [Panus rudis PR-1116 ss-1]